MQVTTIDTKNKRPVMPTLRKMEIGEPVEFSRSQYATVLSSIHRVKIQYYLNFSVKILETSVEVTRTA